MSASPLSPPDAPLSAAEQARLLDLATDAIFVRDLEGYVRYWNLGAETLYGWTRAEALGRRSAELLASRYPQPLADIEAAARQAGRWEGEIEHRRKDGGRVLVSSRWALQTDPAGRPIGFLESNTDITARRSVEEALRRGEAKFRALLESAPDAMIIVNARGSVELANRRAEEIFAAAPGTLDGREIELLLPERFRDAHRRYRENYAREARSRPMGSGLELFALRDDGGQLPVEVSLSPVQQGEETLVIAAVRDISDRKRAEAAAARLHALELAKAEHLATLGEIAAGLAHEIKNPLAGIAAALEVLAGEWRQEREVMDEVRRQVLRIRDIVDDLLHYARPRPLRAAQENLNLAAARAVHLAAHAAQPRSVQVIFTPAPLPLVPHDPEQIERLVANLTLNAIQAAPDGGRVEINTAREPGPPPRTIIRVRDNGPGIPADALPKIFRPFFTTKGDQGNGLGLALCRRIAELHGGGIEVATVPGHGSTFTVLLPDPAPGDEGGALAALAAAPSRGAANSEAP